MSDMHPHYPKALRVDFNACPAYDEGTAHRSHSWNAGAGLGSAVCPGVGDVYGAQLDNARKARTVPVTADVTSVANPRRTVVGIDQQDAPMDMLRQIFESQAYFQGLLGHDYNGMSVTERVSYLKDQILALTDEAHEALNEMGWKPWATSRHLNEKEFAGELADILCFLVNLALGVGLTSEDFYLLHQEKAQRNIKRQHEKYDGVTGKCPQCNRALDDLTAKGIKLPEPILDGNIQMCSAACIAAYNYQTKEAK